MCGPGDCYQDEVNLDPPLYMMRKRFREGVEVASVWCAALRGVCYQDEANLDPPS